MTLIAMTNLEVNTPNQMNDAATHINSRSYCDKYGSFLCAKGRCVESGSSYQCKCNSGYQESMDGKSCYGTIGNYSSSYIMIQTLTNVPRPERSVSKGPAETVREVTNAAAMMVSQFIMCQEAPNAMVRGNYFYSSLF